MIKIGTNQKILFTRGDADVLSLRLVYEDSLNNIAYFPQRNDKIFFAIMEPNQSFEDAIVKKSYIIKDLDDKEYDSGLGILHIRLESYETEFLTPGRYYYQVKLLKKDIFDDTQEDGMGSVETVIPKTSFDIAD